MLTKALVLTDGEADWLSRALEEVKSKTFEESQISLDDVGALCRLDQRTVCLKLWLLTLLAGPVVVVDRRALRPGCSA